MCVEGCGCVYPGPHLTSRYVGCSARHVTPAAIQHRDDNPRVYMIARIFQCL